MIHLAILSEVRRSLREEAATRGEARSPAEDDEELDKVGTVR